MDFHLTEKEDAFRDDVRRFLEHRPVRARRASPGAALLKLVRRHPLAATVLAAALFAVVGVWFGTQRSLERVRASETIAWRAHRDAVYATNLLADVLTRVGAGEAVASEVSGTAGGVCQAAPAAALLLEEEMTRLRDYGAQLAGSPKVVVLNGRGYNYGPRPGLDSIHQQLQRVHSER